MIDVFICGRKYQTRAYAKYDKTTKETIVKKGSVVSEMVSDFVHKNSVLRLRTDNVDKDGVLTRDVSFKNPTSAAQFVCGYSVSGPVAWHVDKHKTLAVWLKENQ